jgi:uncharacterized protein
MLLNGVSIHSKVDEIKVTLNRRAFVKIGTALSALGSLHGGPASDTEGANAAVRAMESGRMAFSPATWYRPYVSKTARDSATPTWIQIDLGAPRRVEAIRLYPAFGLGEKHMDGYGFPVRFKVEGSNDPSFAGARLLVDNTAADCPNPDDRVMEYAAQGEPARFIRLTATRLRGSRDGIGYSVALSRIEVISDGKDVAGHRPVTGDPIYASSQDLSQLTRPPRPMGERIVTDNPGNVIPASLWKPARYQASAPLTGVAVSGETFRDAMEKNIGYLLRSFSVEEMLRPFRERAGKPVRAGLRPPVPFWDTGLPGSSAGRFLMGAGNTLRWMEHAELRRSMNELVSGIEECRAPNGYIMAYPEETILESERGAYTRAWLTHGLIEAGYAGNAKAFDLLRSYYDWFDHCPYLPTLLRGAAQGVQGMIANTRMYFTPVGKPEDIQVIQRYFQENYWLAGLAQRDPQLVWQYPYDRPHNYLITDLEAYLDLYRATGERRYLDAMEGAWELYHDNWEHVGGSIAITEFGEFPPKSYRLVAQEPFCETGETCGSVFWTRFNQRFHLLYPKREKYVSEIEKSIYNVGLANQVGSNGIIYHARLVGQKGDLAVPLCTNSCCEGQGTRLLGSLPEYIYSIAPDGIYVNLYEASSIRWPNPAGEMTLTLSTKFPFRPDVKLHVTSAKAAGAKIRIRVPAWATGPMPIHVNGSQAATGQPGSYVTLDRIWSSGDAITFTLPIGFRLTRYAGLDRIEGHERFALEYGPVLLALTGSSSAVLKVTGETEHAGILRRLKEDPDRPLRFHIDGHPEYVYIPYWQVVSEPFTCYPVIDLA